MPTIITGMMANTGYFYDNRNKTIIEMKRFWAIACLLLIASIKMAAAVISGTLVSSTDQSPLAGASVKLMRNNADSTFVTAVSAGNNGSFKLKSVARGKYIVSFSFLGYETLMQNIEVKSSDINMGRIPMAESSILLAETTVVGVKTEIVVKEDTIEYNADSYRTQPNAVVEDLLKRLPGVEVDSEGKITANGKEITKILVDGEEFFSDDPKVATKNLPVNIVDKLQVIDRKSDLARLTGVDDGEDETVINLTVKKGMKNGWFGNFTGGYGTDERYTGNFMVNYFRDKNQFTILGSANNTNEMGFTDRGASRFTRFGGNRGISSTQSIGLNFAVGTEEKLRIGGDLFYSHSDRDSRNSSNRQYLFTDSTSYYDAAGTSRDRGHNISGNFRLKWEIDSFSTLEFRPRFAISFSDSESADSSATRAGDANRSLVNRSLGSKYNDGTSYEFSGRLIFNHKFRSHPGRSYSASLNYQFSDVKENGNTYTDNTYYLVDGEDENINQIYDNHQWSNNVQGRLTWTEPLGNIKNARFLTFSYNGQYRFNNADKYVYDLVAQATGTTAANSALLSMLGDPAFKQAVIKEYGSLAWTNPTMLTQIVEDELQPELNEEQSNRFRNNYFNQSIQVGFKQVRDNYNLDVGAMVNSSMSSSEDLINPDRNIATRWVWNVAPYARIRLKMNQSRSLSFDYRARSSQPSLTQLQPVADVSNPLRIVVGNPDLKPTFTQRVNLRYSDFNQEKQRSIMAMANFQFATNSIISTTDYDSQTGGQVTTYENVNGVWNANLMGMASLPFRNKSWYFSSMAALRYSNTVGYNNSQYNRSGSFSVNLAPDIRFNTDAIQLELRPNYNVQITHNTVQSQNDRTIHSYGGMFNGAYYTPFGLVFNTDISYSGTKGYSDGYDSNQWLWNASISYQFLKNKAATITAKVYDLLHQRQNISRTINASYIEDSEYNAVTRYAMFTFTYRFTTFGNNSSADEPPINYDGRRPGGHRRGAGGPPPGGMRRGMRF